METKQLKEEHLEKVDGGSGLADTVGYVVDQGKKVAEVISDAIEDIFKKN